MAYKCATICVYIKLVSESVYMHVCLWVVATGIYIYRESYMFVCDNILGTC